MLVAVARPSQLFRLLYAVEKEADVEILKKLPLAFRRFNPLRMFRHAGSWAARIFWPLELLQKPSVSPFDGALKQKLPNVADRSQFAASIVTVCAVGVVLTQLLGTI